MTAGPTKLRVVIPTVGRAGSVRRCLDSVDRSDQHAVAVAITLVDNALPADSSTHETLAAVAAAHHCEVVLAVGGLASARQVALQVGRDGETLVLIDDDEILHPDYFNEVVRLLAQTDDDLLCGEVRPVLPDGCPAWYASPWAYGRAAVTACRPATFANTGNLVIRAAAVPAARAVGFDAAYDWIGGEDTDFSLRCVEHGLRIVKVPGLVVYEYVASEKCTKVFLRRKVYRQAWLWSAVSRRRKASTLGAMLAAAREVVRAVRLAVSLWRPHPEGYWLLPALRIRCAFGRVAGSIGVASPALHRSPN